VVATCSTSRLAGLLEDDRLMAQSAKALFQPLKDVPDPTQTELFADCSGEKERVE